MSKVAVVFWSGTGNTEAMANAVCAGAGAEAKLIPCDDFNADMVAEFDKFAFGCPSMGSEELEDSSFEPMFASVEGSLKGKSVALFGSYGWGDGEWMRNWEERTANAGAAVVGTYICNDAPDDDAIEACKALGAKLA